MAIGFVKCLDDKNGYGFISPDDGGSDLFFDHMNIDMENFHKLHLGQLVEYETAQGSKDPKVTKVNLLF